MFKYFKSFKGKIIPILGWNFFTSKEESRTLFSSVNFQGWNDEWLAIATDGLGDIIVLNKDNNLGCINHEERGEPEFNLIAKSAEELMPLIGGLLELPDWSKEEDFVILREIKKQILELRKKAPRTLKIYFTEEAEELQELINDLRFYSTKDGKVIRALLEYSEAVFKELRADNKYLGISIEKDFEVKNPLFIISGWLEGEESLEELRGVVAKYLTAHPVEFRKIYTQKEVEEYRQSKG